MTQERGADDGASPANTSTQCILPLPDDVVAQIKSSTAIESLTGVVLELLKNSIDAKANRVDVTVDFARGGCSVEDDGQGILPSEFTQDGGLGKRYYTSKYHAGEASLGRNGIFLASLAAMSLLTITARHHAYRSHNSITFHQSQSIERQLPASANHKVHSNHGTRVTVRNLFGNLPVRVKQRGLLLDQSAEQVRLWDALTKQVASLMLSWQGPLSVAVRDNYNKNMFSFNTTSSSPPTSVSSVLNVLTQADYISIQDWASWIPASATTPTLSIKGTISLDPAPSKNVQFISLNLRPLFADSGHNELYHAVNRLFALSSFGTIEGDGETNHTEKTRRQTGKRRKKDKLAPRQVSLRKGVDRYPMFHLRISLKDAPGLAHSDDEFFNDEANLQTVIEVLGAMITQWLSVHHFRPRMPRQQRQRPRPSSSVSGRSGEDSRTNCSDQAGPPSGPEAEKHFQLETTMSDTTTTSLHQQKRPSTVSSNEVSAKLQPRAFAEWSRIKSGKANFLNAVYNVPELESRTKIEKSSRQGLTTFATFGIIPVSQGALNFQSADGRTEKMPMQDARAQANNADRDETILWTDPSTKETYLLNSRTGCARPDIKRKRNADSTLAILGINNRETKRSLRLAPRSTATVTGQTPWLDDVLQTWDNPVFKLSERRIQQATLNEDGINQAPHHHCSGIDSSTAMKETSEVSSSRLSKDGLKNAHVLAQVDKKFVLVKMRSSPTHLVAQASATELFVMIDQHAADERVQVEFLLRELCTPLADDTAQASHQSNLGHRSRILNLMLEKPMYFTISFQESTHFTAHAAKFAEWGILFDALKTASSTTRPGMLNTDHAILAVTHLPPVISERCKTDPQLLISFLRCTVWKYAEDPHVPSYTPFVDDSPSNWTRNLARCPQGLVELINSRACRSAIMFNDELTLSQCEDLVNKLAKCMFPFMCAHGRPSMVPLVDLGSLGTRFGGINGENLAKQDRFVEAWTKWRN